MVEDQFRYGMGFALNLSIEMKGFEVADCWFVKLMEPRKRLEVELRCDE